MTVSTGVKPTSSQKRGEARQDERVWPTVEIAEAGRMLQARKVERADLSPLARIDGPALVVEDQTTTVVPSAFSVFLDESGDLVMEKQ